MSLKVVFRLAVISIIGAAVVGQVLGSRDDATGAEIEMLGRGSVGAHPSSPSEHMSSSPP